MTDFASIPVVREQQIFGRGTPPLRPAWLHPLSTMLVIATYVIFFASFIYWVIPKPVSLGAFDAELVREGDFLDEDASADTDFKPADDSTVQEAYDEVALALPSPLIMAPETTPVPLKKETVDKSRNGQKKRPVETGAGNDDRRSAGRTRRRFGLPGARGTGSGSTPATCLALVAASLRQHTPAVTSLGPGTANVTFYVHLGGGVSGVAASGSTPGHAALARRIVASARGPGNCGEFFANQAFRFH